MGINPAQKLIVGMLSSPSSGVSGHDTSNAENKAFVQCALGNGNCDEQGIPALGLKGVMTWLANWDLYENAQFVVNMHTWFEGQLPTPTPTPTPSMVHADFDIQGLPSAVSGNVNFVGAEGEEVSYAISQLQLGIDMAVNDYSVHSIILHDQEEYHLSTSTVSIAQGASANIPSVFIKQQQAQGSLTITLNGLPQEVPSRLVTIKDLSGSIVLSQVMTEGKLEVVLNTGIYNVNYQGYSEGNVYYSAANSRNVMIEKDQVNTLNITYAIESQYQKVQAYYPAWGTYGRDHQIHHLDAKDLGTLYYAFLNVSSDGTVSLGDKYADMDEL